MKLGSPYSVNMENILEEISLYCKNFCHLEIVIIELFWREVVSAIVTFLPNIKYLYLRDGFIDQESLEIILQACKELVHLNVEFFMV